MGGSHESTEVEDLLNLQLPCSIPTATLEALVKCIYDDGTMEIDHKVLLPTLQLADAIQVRVVPIHALLQLPHLKYCLFVFCPCWSVQGDGENHCLLSGVLLC